MRLLVVFIGFVIGFAGLLIENGIVLNLIGVFVMGFGSGLPSIKNGNQNG